MHQLPCFHVVYADREGNIFYLYNAKTGQRFVPLPSPLPETEEEGGTPPPPPLHIDWSAPRAGEDPVGAWEGIVPVEALPAIENPATGYIQACGNPPWGVSSASPLRPTHWPSWLVTDPDTYRAKRVRQLLDMGRRSFRDSQSMVYDVLVPFALEAVPWLLNVAEEREAFVTAAHPDLSAGLELLRHWDFVAEKDAEAMTFFHAWWTTLSAMEPALFPNAPALYAAMGEGSARIKNMAIEAAAEAARTLRNEFSRITVPWGDIHVIRRGKREEPVFGASTGEPIFVASDTVYDRGVWPATYGVGFAMVIQFDKRPQAVSVVPFGASEDAESPHFDDQLDLLIDRRFKHARFLDSDVYANARSALGRFPTLRPKGMDGLITLRAPYVIAARVYTSAEAPAPLPEGLATFSIYVGPEYVPRAVPVEVHIEVAIPETVCAPDDMDQLGIHVCRNGSEWEPLETTRFPERPHVLLADDAGMGVYAVLGPETCRRAGAAIDIKPPPETEQEQPSAQPGPRAPELPEAEMPPPREKHSPMPPDAPLVPRPERALQRRSLREGFPLNLD